MSKYLRGYDVGNYYPHAQLHEPITVGRLTNVDVKSDDFSSDSEIAKRDIDTKIEARPQHEQYFVATHRTPPSPPPIPRTMSQRMLQLLQQHRAQNRAEASLLLRRHSSRTVKRCQEDSVVNKKTALASSKQIADAAFDTLLSSRSGSSCTDRLEARISKSFLARRDNELGRRGVERGEDASLLYSGRRTYPAESMTTMEHARLSDDLSSKFATLQETRMMAIMNKERATRVSRSQISCPEVSLAAKTDTGVKFHFRRGSPVDKTVLDKPTKRLVLTDGRVDAHVETLVGKAQSQKRVTDPEYTTLASQLADIESLVDSIEKCMKKPSFSELAAFVLNEMELLANTTQQIRTKGTTLILANVGKHQNADFIQGLRRLVARAVSVQGRISAFMDTVKQLVM